MDNVSLYPEWKQVVRDILDNFTYGDALTKQWLKPRLGVVIPEVGTSEVILRAQLLYMQAMGSVKNALLEDHNMYLLTKPGLGFIICKPENQTQQAMQKYRRKVRKETHQVISALVNLNIEDLSDKQVKERDDALNNIAAIAAFSGKRLTDV